MITHKHFPIVECHCYGRSLSPSISPAIKSLSYKEKIKFTLHCVEDCFQFHNVNTKSIANNCIKLIKKWLASKNTNYKLKYKICNAVNAARRIYIHDDTARNALMAVESAIAGCFYNNGEIDYCCIYASDAHAGNGNKTKLQEYFSLASFLHSTKEDKIFDKQLKELIAHTTPYKKDLKTAQIDFSCILDRIEEMYGNELIVAKEDKFYLNLPQLVNPYATEQELRKDLAFNNSCFFNFVREQILRIYS